MKLRSVRGALLLIAAALVVAALVGPVQRAWQARSIAAASKSLAEQVARERDARAAELTANREQILAGLREQLRTGDSLGAMNAAARFAPVNDPEVREIHRKAAAAVSAKQDLDNYRRLVARDCTESTVRYQLAQLQDSYPPRTEPSPPQAFGELALSRLLGSEASAPVLARLREPPPSESPLPAEADWITRVQTFNRSQVQPDYVAAVLGDSAQEFLCVWRIEGARLEQGRSVAFTMVLWLPPARDGKGLSADPLIYSERKP